MTEEDFYNQHKIIDTAIVNAMIGATPETWSEIELILTNNSDNDVIKISHEIISPEGHKDIVSATDELHDATFQLFDIYSSNKKQWAAIKYIAQLENGNWRYNAHFTY